MYDTRQRAKPSFTVEIKRANKRLPASDHLGKTNEWLFSRAMPDAAARVDPPDRYRKTLTRESGLACAVSAASSPDAESPASVRQPRRVLPDLLSASVDPVEHRMKQLAEERVARRRASLERAATKTAAGPAREPREEMARSARPHPEEREAAPAAPAEPASPSQTAVSAVLQPKPARDRTTYADLCLRKARRAGPAMPRFPAGERWKRRLPRACW